MKTEWSREWIASRQARKQRKFRYNAPLHVRHKFLSTHLSKDLRQQYKVRSFPLRKGDEVQIMRGKFAGTRGAVESVDMKKLKIYVDGVKIKKTDGREVTVALEPSNLKILRFNLDDKERQKALERRKSKKAGAAAAKNTEKAEEKKKEKVKEKKETEKSKTIVAENKKDSDVKSEKIKKEMGTE